MEHKKYELSESLQRMQDILDSKGEEYRKYRFIPQEGVLPEHKGYFVDCAVIASRLYFHVNDLSQLGVAKIYDIYINETKCILAENELCQKIILHGNTIIGIYTMGPEGFLNELTDVAGRLSSLPDVINTKVGRKSSPLIGNVCSLEAGYQFAVRADDGIDFFGGMLNRAESWIVKRGEDEKEPKGLFISQVVRDNLKEQYQKFFQLSRIEGVYHGYIENIGMSRWVKEQYD